MKKIHLFALLAATSVIALVSCNKEIETPDYGADSACPEGYYVEELTAVYPRDPETRTAFNETTGRFAWTEGDELAFHLSNGEYVAAPIDPATGKVKLYLPVGVTRDNYAVYPASAIVDEAAAIGNMKITVPDTYDISADPRTDYVPTPLVAWNAAENTHLKFEHVGGLLQVNLTVPAGVKTATVSMGKTIAGTFSLEDGTGNGIIVPGESSSDGITFILSENGLTEDTQVKLLTPLPTGSYDLFKVNYDNGFEFSKDLSANPWVFARSGGKKVSIAKNNFEDPTDYFWYEALEAGSTVCFSNSFYGSTVQPYVYTRHIYYSVDNKKTWHLWPLAKNPSNGKEAVKEFGSNLRYYHEPIVLENVGDRVYFYCTDEKLAQGIGGGNSYPTSGKLDKRGFFSEGRTKIGGDIRYMINKGEGPLPEFAFFDTFCQDMGLEDARDLKLPTDLSKNCFRGMFMFSNLIYPPELLATELAYGCYHEMFLNCHNLITPPELPATEMTVMAYNGMFHGCVNLTEVPELPATKLAAYCYSQMFDGCHALTDDKLPVLSAEKMEDYCYARMFEDCWGLTSLHNFELNSTELAPYCYYGMFQSCDNLVEPIPVLPAQNLSEHCYDSMFEICDKLTSFPLLPAQNLANGCYKHMFAYCDILCDEDQEIKELVLPANTLAESCYESMFYSTPHDNLTIKIMATDVDYPKAMKDMFYGSLSESNNFSVYVYFTEWPADTSSQSDYPLYRWLYNNYKGKIYKPESLPTEFNRSTRIPVTSNVNDTWGYSRNWTVVDY